MPTATKERKSPAKSPEVAIVPSNSELAKRMKDEKEVGGKFVTHITTKVAEPPPKVLKKIRVNLDFMKGGGDAYYLPKEKKAMFIVEVSSIGRKRETLYLNELVFIGEAKFLSEQGYVGCGGGSGGRAWIETKDAVVGKDVNGKKVFL